MVCKYCTIIINKTKYSIMDKVVEDSVLKNLRWCGLPKQNISLQNF